ncbi:hypothetical protein BpHYR1_048900 [Brachionus plicatilis]|uniref:Uncharacterized protein n=1 Tax=Brachionus plicatilis TaxID=10195 RepID=A0A3M7SSA7_BRAPC|nr:hypothetical protein BpHYR1_048900 [Brachionus plicatilis]
MPYDLLNSKKFKYKFETLKLAYSIVLDKETKLDDIKSTGVNLLHILIARHNLHLGQYIPKNEIPNFGLFMTPWSNQNLFSHL